MLGTGHITFPLVERDYVRRVKRGELPYVAVAERLEELMEQVNQAKLTSALPDQIDRDLADAIVMDAYGLFEGRIS